SYDGIAFIKIFSNATTPLAKIPIEIVDDRTVSVPVSANPEADRRGQLTLRRDRWLRRVFDALEVAANVIKEINNTGARDAAMKLASSGVKALETDIKNLTTERDSLASEVKQANAVVDLDE